MAEEKEEQVMVEQQRRAACKRQSASMDEQPRKPESSDQPGPLKPKEGQPLILRSEDLFQSHREVWIEHGEEMYRLRLTAAGKLYLTK
jgi:hemin uptake protein HemP